MSPPTADGDDSVWRDVLRQTQIDQVTDKVLEQESIVREGNIWPASFLDIYSSRIFLPDKQTYHIYKPYFLCNLVLIFKILYKCNAEEYSIEIVLGLIDKDIQGVLLGHLNQGLRWKRADQEQKHECGTSWAITFVSAECDFVSICNVSSFRPFLQNKRQRSKRLGDKMFQR